MLSIDNRQKPQDNATIKIVCRPMRKLTPKEIETLKAAKNGNLAAFEKILFQYEKMILNYAYRFVNNRQDAEDLTQEIFIKVYRSLRLVDPENNFKAWVYKIATNTIYDYLRKKQKNKELLILDDPERPFETIDNKSSYRNIEADRDIECALQKIKPVYRSALLLFYYQDFTYQEIAKILSMPVNTVKTCLNRAKTALREDLYE